MLNALQASEEQFNASHHDKEKVAQDADDIYAMGQKKMEYSKAVNLKYVDK